DSLAPSDRRTERCRPLTAGRRSKNSAMPASVSAPRAWERGSFRSAERFHAFAHLRDLPLPERSTLRALNAHRTRCLGKTAARLVNGRWKLWSTEDDWTGRLDAWDAEVDQQPR